jgi:hypothetical protein
LWGTLVGLALFGAVLKLAVFVYMTGDLSPMAFVDGMCRWDCTWFRRVADGYEATLPTTRNGEAGWAFFPLYPLLVKAVSLLTTLPWSAVGMLMSTAFGVLAAGAARPLFGGNHRAYRLFAFGLLLGPFSLLVSMPYSEGLFILLTILVLVELQRGDYLKAGLFAALLSATRVTGVLIGLAIVLQAVLDLRRNGTAWRELPAAILGNNRMLLGFALVPLGLVAYMLYLRLAMGDGLAFAHVQLAWGRIPDNPFVQLSRAILSAWPFADMWDRQTTYVLGAIVAIVMTTLVALRGRHAAALFCFAALVLALSTGVQSSVRLAAGLAPLGIVAAEYLSARRRLYWACYPIGLTVGLAIVAGWLSGVDFTMV